MIERVGRIGRAPERLVYRDFRLERKGFISLFSFVLEGARHRFEGVTRPPAVVVLPVDFARRELYLLRELRPLKPFADTEHGKDLLGRVLQGKADDDSTFEVESAQAYHHGMVAGLVDEGETPEEAAVRELREESGLIVPAAHLRRVASTLPSIGGSTEVTHLFIADLPDTHAQDRIEAVGDGGEEIEILKMGWEDAFALMETEMFGVSSGLLLRELKLLDAARRMG